LGNSKGSSMYVAEEAGYKSADVFADRNDQYDV
jgi:hypothetical protein